MHVLKIAVCDDEESSVSLSETYTRQCLEACSAAGEVTCYTRSQNLLCDITEDGFHYDLILLDIEMPETDGMELAEKIKPFLPDVKIIFITSHLEYAIDAYELSIFRYVPKNDIEKRLTAAITDAVRLLLIEEGEFYTIKNGSSMEKIPYHEIYYIMKDGKNSVFHTSRGISKVRKSLQQVYDELAAEEFIFTDRGCIANMVHIMQFKKQSLVLKNQEELPVSRSHVQEVREQITAYWGGTYMTGWIFAVSGIIGTWPQMRYMLALLLAAEAVWLIRIIRDEMPHHFYTCITHLKGI